MRHYQSELMKILGLINFKAEEHIRQYPIDLLIELFTRNHDRNGRVMHHIINER